MCFPDACTAVTVRVRVCPLHAAHVCVHAPETLIQLVTPNRPIRDVLPPNVSRLGQEQKVEEVELLG